MRNTAMSMLMVASSAVAFCGATHPRDEREDQSRPETFTVAQLHEVAAQAVKRFDRLALPDAEVTLIRTWSEPQYAWVRLSYKRTGTEGAPETSILLACHSHGDVLGCHVKTAAGPLEPTDTGSGSGGDGDLDEPIDDSTRAP